MLKLDWAQNNGHYYYARVTNTILPYRAVTIWKVLKYKILKVYFDATNSLITKSGVFPSGTSNISSENLTAPLIEIEDLINKNKYPENKQDLKKDEENKDSALGSIGLKPKIVH